MKIFKTLLQEIDLKFKNDDIDKDDVKIGFATSSASHGSARNRLPG